MDALVDFDINEALKNYQNDPLAIYTPEAHADLFDCEHDPESMSSALINAVLNPIVDSVTEDPETIARASNWDSLQFLLKLSAVIPPTALSKMLDLIVSGLSAEADVIHNDLESADEESSIQHHKKLLEMFAFLLQWSLCSTEARASAEQSAAAPAAARAKGKAVKSKAAHSSKEAAWDPTTQLLAALDAMAKVMKLKLAKIFVTTSERDTFIALFTRPVYLLMENEARVKTTAVRMHSFRVLCIAVKHHGHAFGAQTSIIQSLSYFEHLSEPMAEFLNILAEQYDYPQLAEEVMKELSNKEFSTNDAKGPRSVSTFITKLSELAPRQVIKQIMLLAKLLDSESYTLRCSIIEVCGNLIAMLSKQERDEKAERHMDGFFDVLEDRFRDVNPYCRSRTMQVYMRLCDLDMTFSKRRQVAAELAATSLGDKSSNVRRNAIKLLEKLISTHPFPFLHNGGGELSFSQCSAALEIAQTKLDALAPAEAIGLTAEEPTIDNDLLDDATQHSPQKEAAPMSDEQQLAAFEKAGKEAELINKYKLALGFYSEALRFIKVLHNASPVIVQLLGSKNKSEVIEAMDFFLVADAYRVETATSGIRRMLRLIWTVGNSDEGKGVQTHLIECYKNIYFNAPDGFAANEAATYVARNMISLTFDATAADLTSLEQLLSTMMKQRLINDLVIQKLWQVYGVQRKEISIKQRRGAIIVLGMLAVADPEIIVKEMEICLHIGLGARGRKDLGLARYTCVALMRMNPQKQTKGGEAAPKSSRLPNDHAVLQRLAAMADVKSSSKEWYGLVEQVIGAIYALSKHPDVLCSEIIRYKTKKVFAPQHTKADSAAPAADVETDGDVEMSGMDDVKMEDAPEPEEEVQTETPLGDSGLGLSQLLFTIGHVAIKQIVHLELCEQDYKRRKADMEKKAGSASPVKKASKTPGKGGPAPEDADELDLIAGTTEDEFTDAVAKVREIELLYGRNSLLTNFGPLVREICMNNPSYPSKELQAQAALCLAKLMCVSSDYCEQNLGLLITLMERSPDAVTRSNLVIALGDMAVCFSNLIDENTDFLYRRLSDSSLPVKRTCLTTLTFLILASQIKVKGQLGEMAKCVEDEDEKMRDLSRMFFSELTTKDNAVYNNFVDMFSLLSQNEEMDEDRFRRILKFLSGFIEKDKHARQLASKLAARLARVESERQWNDVAYVLGLLQHKDEEISKVVSEGYKTVQAAA